VPRHDDDSSDTLTDFSDNAARHMEIMGTDSVIYFTDPSTKDRMLNYLFHSPKRKATPGKFKILSTRARRR
jgi:hypothetical protein